MPLQPKVLQFLQQYTVILFGDGWTLSQDLKYNFTMNVFHVAK